MSGTAALPRLGNWLQSSRASRQKCRVPMCVGSVGYKSSVEIRCAISPPRRSTLPESALYLIDRCASAALCFGFARLQGGADLPACIHQPFDQVLPFFRRELGITHAPEAARYNEVPAIRSAWMFVGGWHGGSADRAVIATSIVA